MSKDLPDPYVWSSGPPKTESEGWNFERRTEILKLAAEFTVASLHGLMDRDEFARLELHDLVDVEAIADLATRLRDAVEKKCPRH